MNETTSINYTSFVIPPSIITPADVARMILEFENIDNDLTTSAARQKVSVQDGVSVTVSPQLKDFMTQNKLEADSSTERTAIIKQLRILKSKMPVVHMTFAAEADSETLQYLVQWLRQTVHAQTVITVGLQPNLVAGVYMRTTNRVYDFSMRTQLRARRDVLTKTLESVRANI